MKMQMQGISKSIEWYKDANIKVLSNSIKMQIRGISLSVSMKINIKVLSNSIKYQDATSEVLV